MRVRRRGRPAVKASNKQWSTRQQRGAWEWQEQSQGHRKQAGAAEVKHAGHGRRRGLEHLTGGPASSQQHSTATKQLCRANGRAGGTQAIGHQISHEISRAVAT